MASNIEKISIAVTSEMAEMLRKAVASGQYATTSEVVREALRDWQTHSKRREQSLEELRALIQEGVDSGPGKYDTLDAIKQAARQRFGKLD
jgi:antitoxin ParD1/3/4